jgi:Zn-dependent protease
MFGGPIDIIFYIAVLVFSIIIHEIAHGLAADKLGDPTARMEGRLTLNPIPHIDPIGSIILPLILILTGSPFLVGWAKPVPFNPLNFRQNRFIQKFGEAIVAIAGPASNIAIALVVGITLRFMLAGGQVAESTASIMTIIVLVNLVLAVFNLMPIPPLDGSKIIFSFFPYSWRGIRYLLESNAIIFALIFIVFVWKLIIPIIPLLFSLITGISLY